MKNTFKKFTGIILSLLILISATACSSDSVVKINDNNSTSFYSKVSFSETEINAFIEKVKAGDNSYEAKYGINSENVEETFNDLKSNAKTEKIDEETYYYYEVSESFQTVKELEKYFEDCANNIDGSLTLAFSEAEVTKTEAWFKVYPHYVFHDIVSVNTFKLTMPYKITKTNGTVSEDYTATFDLTKSEDILYVVTENSNVSWGNSEDIEDSVISEIVNKNKPKKTTGLKVSYRTKTTLKVSWNYNFVTYEHDYAGYELQRKIGKNGSWKTVKRTKDSADISYVEKKVKTNSKYYYRVRAFSNLLGKNSYGTFSNVKSITTVKFSTKPNIKKVIPNKKSISVIIRKKVNNVTGYQIQYSKNKKFKTSKKILTKKLNKKITKLSSKKTYYVRVRTYKRSNGKVFYGSWSNVRKVKTK